MVGIARGHIPCIGRECCTSVSPREGRGANPELWSQDTHGVHGSNLLRSRPFPPHIRHGVPRLVLTALPSATAVGVPHDQGEKLLCDGTRATSAVKARWNHGSAPVHGAGTGTVDALPGPGALSAASRDTTRTGDLPKEGRHAHWRRG